MLTPSQLLEMMSANDLSVLSVLADAGNGEIKHAVQDLSFITGEDNSVSTPDRILHWDAEWHYDPVGVTFERKEIGGHLVLLGLKHGGQPWAEYSYPILSWASTQGGIAGFAHMQYLPLSFYPTDGIPQSLSCCTPLEYPVETALGSSTFLMEDVRGSDSAVQAYYRLLNTGFRPGFVAGTDYPCNDNEPPGTLLTYVQVPNGRLTYEKWIDGIAQGRTVVSRNAHHEFLDLKVNATAQPGDEVRLDKAGAVRVKIEWNSTENNSGRIELIQNGSVVASQSASVSRGKPAVFETEATFQRSGWLAARRMDWQDGHRTHTGAIFVIVKGGPVRTSAQDARFFVQWIDHLLQQTSPTGLWQDFFKTDLEAAQKRYREAREIFVRIASEAEQVKTVGTDAGAAMKAMEAMCATAVQPCGSGQSLKKLRIDRN